MAVTIGAAELATATGAPQATAERLLPVCTALVEQYAAVAPAVLQNEAVLRCAGWLWQRTPASIRSVKVDEVETEFASAQLGAIHHSGAAGLLSPWRKRRATVGGTA